MEQYLIGIGVRKAGTTLLYDILQDHPALCLGKKKELHYFENEMQPTKAAYDALFHDAPGLKFDYTPAYMYYDGCIERLANTLDLRSVKALVLLRDPIDRAVSQYAMSRVRGLELCSLEDAFDREAERIHVDANGMRHHSYFSRGLYADQLDTVFRFFPKENVKIMVFEHFVKHQQAVVDEVTAFAGIDPITVKPSHSNPRRFVKSARVAYALRTIDEAMPSALARAWGAVRRAVERLNAGQPQKEALSDAFLHKLQAYYAGDVARLRAVYGVDTSLWKHFPND